ncbi:MAG TPA: glutamate--tRNA ligase family protein, partial [Phycisphaerae bacterium]|nr:glutamate--tRNA ligase family protein [Phycisphaerae bacterium]
ILRIEDTDIQRNIEGADAKLREDLRWLGITWDEGPGVGGPCAPYNQSERLDLYRAAERKLLESGRAYYAFDTAEELDAMRKEASAKKISFRYTRPARFPSDADAERARAEGRSVVVRFAVPDEPITVHDDILGDVTFGAGEVEDLVIVKSNGWPTYHFAVVVDDEQMRVTHVLRAQEHLMNTPKHVFMQRALGYRTPVYAHLPLVFNMDGTKMSKRDKHKVVRAAVKEKFKSKAWTKEEAALVALCELAVLERWLDKADTELDMAQVGRLAEAAGAVVPEIEVHDFRLSGYLPEALLNFVALIGWSPGGDREMLTLDEMIQAFSLDRINKTAGRFDREKLLAMNTDYCASVGPKRLLAAFKDWAAASGSPLASLDAATMARALEACKGMRTLRDVETKAGILFAPNEAVQYDPAAVKKVLEKNGGAGYAMLEKLLPEIGTVEPWTAAGVDALIKRFCDALGAGLGDVAQPLRVAVAGRPVSPAIGDTLELLGREKTLQRLKICIESRGAG